MPKNIAIFSDGTGQAGGLPKKQPSNVYRLFRACPVTPGVQETFYEHGVGAPPVATKLTPWRRLHDVVSCATGLGIARNIADCYDALIRMYEPGDRIFLFGFSRGAYTVRSLAGMLAICGIPQQSSRGVDLRKDGPARRRVANHAVRHVYQHYGNSEDRMRERHARAAHFRGQHRAHVDGVSPHFIGVWDTVRAVGLPGLHKIAFWRHQFHDSRLDERVRHARQALSIDENRAAFFPEVWEERDSDRQSGRIKQLWFPGVHSDVGGGYHERGLADLTLNWMIEEATAVPDPLLVDKSLLAVSPSYRGMQHDERRGLGVLWRKGTREGFHNESLSFENDVRKRIAEKTVPTVYGDMAYRPPLLARYPEFGRYYQAIDARRRGILTRLKSLGSGKWPPASDSSDAGTAIADDG
jgi:uncharacterized protein (DUF2235 family)